LFVPQIKYHRSLPQKCRKSHNENSSKSLLSRVYFGPNTHLLPEEWNISDCIRWVFDISSDCLSNYLFVSWFFWTEPLWKSKYPFNQLLNRKTEKSWLKINRVKIWDKVKIIPAHSFLVLTVNSLPLFAICHLKFVSVPFPVCSSVRFTNMKFLDPDVNYCQCFI
jgi:hypothetical protein